MLKLLVKYLINTIKYKMIILSIYFYCLLRGLNTTVKCNNEDQNEKVRHQCGALGYRNLFLKTALKLLFISLVTDRAFLLIVIKDWNI